MRTIVQSNVDAYLVLKTLFEEHAKYNDQIIRYDERTLLKTLKNQLSEPITINEVFETLAFDGLIHINPSSFADQPQLISISIKGANAFQKFKTNSHYIYKIDEVKTLFNPKDADIYLFNHIDNSIDDLRLRTIRIDLCNYFFGNFLGL